MVRERGFHLDVEDYLAGVLIMASELVSLLLSYYLSYLSFTSAVTLINIETEFCVKMMPLCCPPVTVGSKQRHSRRLQPAAAHLQLHQRAGLRLPPAQPEERPTA